MKEIVIFNEGGYTVGEREFRFPLGRHMEYIISDGVHSCSTPRSGLPELNLKSIKKYMQEYLQERRDSLDDEIKEITE